MFKHCSRGIIVFCLFTSLHANIPINLEFAITPDETAWGLMGRDHLAPNQGMLFIAQQPRLARIWAFNCLIDLSVAFIDDNHVIREIHELRAYPEKMDPARPVRSLKDMDLYSSNDPIVQFFHAHAVASQIPVKYTLEMSTHWFEQNGVKPGDIVIWDDATGKGDVVHN